MKKYFFALIFIFCISNIFHQKTVTAFTGNLPPATFAVVNDEMKTERPELKGNKAYVPIEFFIKYLSVDFSVSQGIVLTKGKSIFIDTQQKQIETETGEKIHIDLYSKGNQLMLPVDTAQFFGYQVTYTSNGIITRIKNEDALLSDDDVYNKYKGFIQSELKKIELQRLEEQKKAEELKNKKIIYLTFDDGPNSRCTADILDTLSKYNMKATFFMLDGHMKSNKPLVERMVKEGHALGLHGVTHDVKKAYSSTNSVLNEMNTANSTLYSIVRKKTLMVRVPYGSKPYMKKDQLEALEASGYKMWDWNIDSGDTKNDHVSASDIYNNTIYYIQKHKYPVVLFHDKTATAAALPKLLEYLKSHNYEPRILTPDMTPVNFWN